MAMVGNPPIVFLDEPSTGMDPKAKRFMWSIISKISTLRKKSTVILTTHSMEEAEALCTKIGIMVNGKFKCFGSGQHIKDKFGTGYEVEVKIEWPSKTKALETIQAAGFEEYEQVSIDKLSQFLIRLKFEQLLQSDSFEAFRNDLQESGSCTIIDLVLWAILESNGLEVMKQLQKFTTDVSILEHYNNFFRF